MDEKVDFKVGDILYTWGGPSELPQLETITSITPKGNLKTDAGKIYYPNGSERNGDIWHSRLMKKATEEEINKIKYLKRKKSLLYSISKIKWEGLSVEILEKVLEMSLKND